ncbi:MAG: ABC transporter permease [Anaerolineae bacterium]
MSQWRSFITVVFGVLASAVIGASVPLYTSALTQVGLVQHLAAQPPSDVHISERINLRAKGIADLDGLWAKLNLSVAAGVRDIFEAGLPGWVDQTVSIAETDPMRIIRNGEDSDARGRVAYYDRWQETTQLVEGTWPAELRDTSGYLEVAIGLRAATALGLNVGDEIVLDQRGWESSIPVQARITAVVREADESDPYWMAPSPLRLGSSSEGQLEINVLTTRAGFLRVAADYIPETRSTFGWRIYFDHTRLPFGQVDDAVALLATSEADLSQRIQDSSGLDDLRALYTTKLPQILKAFTEEVARLNAPFGLVLLQVGALALFFLGVIAALVRRSERREIAVLQSRGAYDWQILLLRGLEALFICGLATLVAPFVARAILVWLIPRLTGLERLPLPISSGVFVYAGAVALVAWIALVITLRPILQLPLIQAGGSAARGEKPSWMQRYLLDVLLVVIGLAALGRLASIRSALMTTQQGQLQVDPLLLLAPTFFLVGLGSILLRLFPTVMKFAARFSAARRGLETTLALWQVSREPAHYSQITFLLALAIGIGWFAANFQTTITLSHRDQARYFVGADIRLETRDTALDLNRAVPPAIYQAMPEVQAATSAWRFYLSNAARGSRQSAGGEILAVDSTTIGGTAYWRDDLGPIQYPPHPSVPVPGRALPFSPAQIGVWARFDEEDMGFNRPFTPEQYAPWLSLGVRLQDEAGTLVNLSLSPHEPDGVHTLAGAEGWVYYEGDLSTLAYEPVGVVRLDSIYWSFRRTYWFGADFRLTLADLTLTDAAQGSIVLDWLTSVVDDDRWQLVNDPLAPGEKSLTTLAPAPGAPSLPSRQITWRQGESLTSMGLFLDYPEIGPIPAVASDTLMAMNELLPGARAQIGSVNGIAPWFEIVTVASHFPTLYPDERLFLVADQSALLYTLNRRPGVAMHPTEAWLRLAPGVDASTFAAQLSALDDNMVVMQALTLPGYMHALQTDTLSVGLIGVLYLAFLIALALSIVSLLNYVSLTVQARRVEFGVLRALGLSAGRVVASIALELIVLMVTAGLIGSALGAVLSYQILPIFAASTSGKVTTPPLVVQVEATTLLQYSLILIAVLVVTLATSLLSVWRQTLSQTLRLGEE